MPPSHSFHKISGHLRPFSLVSLRRHDKIAAAEKRSTGGGWRAYTYPPYSDHVAAVVASTQPERALDTYHRGLDVHLKHADISAYESCASYLRKMRPIPKSLGRQDEWTRLLADIQQEHRNPPRFMEILDKLEDRTILQAQRSRRDR